MLHICKSYWYDNNYLGKSIWIATLALMVYELFLFVFFQSFFIITIYYSVLWLSLVTPAEVNTRWIEAIWTTLNTGMKIRGFF